MSETSFLVEQAVFSVNLARRSSNGRNEAALVDASEGTTREDLDAALDWATRVETFDAGYDPLNLFFLPTPSGALAIGRLTPTEKAKKDAFYFQLFFVEEDAFFQCGANPVALLHLALNTSCFALYRPGANLEAFRLETRAPWIDQEDLRRTTERLGIRALTTLIQTILDSKRTTFIADYNAFQVVAALFELTPIHWRPSMTFAVGVRFSGDSLARLVGSTAKRGDDRWSVEAGTTFCDLRDVVERDDAYPIENAWAALVELALKSNRVDYIYERMAEEFFLFQKRRDAGDERGASSDEVVEMGLRWRLDLEDAIRGKKNETNDVGDFGDETTDGESADESEPFFAGEFEGGWRDSDGDEGWQVDETDAAAEKGTATDDRVAPEFVFILEPTETERVETSDDREKGRENDAAQKKNDNKEKRDDEKGRRAQPASFDEIFSGESFEDEWAATEGRRDETPDKAGAPLDGEEKRVEKKKDERKQEKGKTALEALRRVFFVKNGVVGAEGKGRWGLVGTPEQIGELVKKERAFDEPLGLDGLASLSALLDERGAEALERLRRATRGDDEKREEDRRASERNARRLRLAPFAALSAEFPGWNEELRRFDALFDDACVGNDGATEELLDFWRRWRRELDDKTVDRIRVAYEERLRGRLSSEDGGAVERTDRLLAAVTIYCSLFLER